MVKILNVRRGFATNSSSSHSIVILPENQQAQAFRDDFDGTGFGWETFTLSSPETKALYVRAQYEGGFDSEAGYVDHQSAWIGYQNSEAEGFQFTDRVTGETISSPEGRAFMERLLRHPRVLVLGGNDNDGTHPLESTLEDQGARSLERQSYTRILDPKGHVVFFNRRTGDKIRLLLEDGEASEKGTWPELVDIKITDFCPYGCSYCYQGSTPSGVHAPLELIEALAEKFRRSGVLEVALGGGEPTLHPQFEQIVNTLAAAGLTVNVTSRNIAYWRKRREMEEEDAQRDSEFYKEHAINKEAVRPERRTPPLAIKAVAFSVDTVEDVRKIKGALPFVYDSFEVHYQVVAGAVSLEAFNEIMDAVEGSRLTLLGYKTTGRGSQAMKSLPVFDSPDQHGYITAWAQRSVVQRDDQRALNAWFSRQSTEYERTHYNEKSIKRWLNDNPRPHVRFAPQLAIDTTLANVCKDELTALGVLPITYSTTEGAFSAYIDAVDETFGPCSYAPARMRPLDVERLWEDYAAMPPVEG